VSNHDDDWREIRRDSRRIMGLAIGWWLLIIALVIATGVGAWAFGVFTSDIKGKGDAIKQKNAANNRIFQQAQFRDQHETITGYGTQIKIAKGAVASASPSTKPARETELLGLQQVCVDTVNDYNARAKQYLAQQFRDADLPERHDPSICEGATS
jgi:hypothetical protein